MAGATLQSNLSVLAQSSQKVALLAMRDTAQFVHERIKVRVPVKTGRLRDSYETLQIGLTELQIGTDVEYAPFQEFGTSRMSARPHLIPAFVDGQAFYEEALARRISELSQSRSSRLLNYARQFLGGFFS